MDNVSEFPIYNLYNIPEALRKLANELEVNPELAEKLVVVFTSTEGIAGYKAFGKNFPRAECVGLLEYGKLLVIGVKSE